MDLDFVSVHKNAKRELGQYPAILTSRLVNNIYIWHLPARRSLLGKTVPEVLSTARGRRPRAVLKTEGTVFPIRTYLGRQITCLFFSSVEYFVLLQLERHQPYETHNIRPRPTISSPDLQYQAPTYNIRPRPTISGPQTKQRFRSCSKRFSPRTASKIHEHFDQQNGTKLFFPQLCFIPFTICQVSSGGRLDLCGVVISWSRWIMSNSRRSTVLCFTASKNKRFGKYLIIIIPRLQVNLSIISR